MTTGTNAYDTLYCNLKNRFTVANDGSEYTLGDFMLMKANKKTPSSKSSLPVAIKNASARGENAVVLFASYINDKLTIKKPPVKDKTIRAFPLRTSGSAFLSALVACAFFLSIGIVGSKVLEINNSVSDEANITEYAPEADVDTTLFA